MGKWTKQWFRGAISFTLAGFGASAAVWIFALLYTGGSPESIIPSLRLVVPGESVFRLPAPGEYIVYFEYKSTIDGDDLSSNSIPYDMDVSIQEVEDAVPIPSSTPELEIRYSTPSRAGVSILEFVVQDSGDFRIDAQYSNGQTTPRIVLAVGAAESLTNYLFLFLVVGFMTCFLLYPVFYRALGRWNFLRLPL